MITRGNVQEELARSPHVVHGLLRTGAAEHWYLESQVALCVPGEGREVTIYGSTQHPSETQVLVAGVLGISRNDVVVEVRRIGGAFGGKETQANHVACWAALLSRATGRPVKIRLQRDDDMIMTGKRHRFLNRYDAGYDGEGRLRAVRIELNSDAGAATDLSFAILERAMLHADNAYYVPAMEVIGRIWKTNLPSNTAFRGFGGPQAIATIETIIDRIARERQIDPAVVRKRNFYGTGDRSVTHYGQQVQDNRLERIYDKLVRSSEYEKRRAAVSAFNVSNEFQRKGLAITPVKFGISFTTSHLNQAGALVHIYTDGTVLVNHGGTELGQGLNTKIRQIAAAELGVPLDWVKVNATNTSKVPNTSATAASSGADLNGMAVKNAVDTLKERIASSMAELFSEGKADPSNKVSIRIERGVVFDSDHPDRSMPFAEVASKLNLRQVSLSATGFYRTPNIGWDKIRGVGKPFHYYAFGMAVSEVLIDLLTGSTIVLRTDILHDVGDSLNPGIDKGQIEGAFVQGLGWCLMEEIKWDSSGHLMTHSPDTYKIPTARDIPRDFRIELLDDAPNTGTIRRSKAVGEPPLMLAFSVWLAVKDAVSSVADHRFEPKFSVPMTNEAILMSVEQLRQQKGRSSEEWHE
jgi:xanthine dehydrogenase molybdopterin binding subunit